MFARRGGNRRNSLVAYFLPDVDEWYKAAYYDPAAGVYCDYPTGSDAAATIGRRGISLPAG